MTTISGCFGYDGQMLHYKLESLLECDSDSYTFTSV